MPARTNLFVLSLSFAVCAAACSRPREPASPATTPAIAQPRSHGHAPPPAPGMVVSVDPATGAFVTPPAAELQLLHAGAATRSALQPLRAEPSVAGGTMVRLPSRFRSYLVATVDERGALTTHCEQGHRAE